MSATSPKANAEQPATRRMRYALCGLSNRGIGLYVPALTQGASLSRYGEIVALVDADTERMAAYQQRERLDLPAYTAADYDRMLEEIAPDAVIVATPDGTHVDYIVAALQRDIDVITEKPMVIDSEQAKAVMDAETRSRASIKVTHNTRYTQANMQVKRMILDGMLGRITNVELVWNIDTYHGSSYFYRWNRDRSKSGGMSITKGCHHFDLMNWWLDDMPEQVFAYGALNYYGARSPFNPSNIDGKDYSVAEQRERDPYRLYWSQGLPAASGDEPLKPLSRLPNPFQYPDDKPMYLYDEEIDIEDTYSAVIRYRGGASMTYSANFSAPYEAYIVALNGTQGRIETTFYADPSRVPFEVPTRQQITYFPMFGPRQVHDTRQVAGSHGGADPLLLRNIFGPPTPEFDELGLSASSLDGALAVAVGEAVWRSVEENRPINIAELLGDHAAPKETTR